MSSVWESFGALHWPTWPEMALGAVLFVLMAGLSIVATGFVLVRIPANYFAGGRPPALWTDRHPIIRWFGHAGKNLLGGVLVVVGVILALPGVPGQGLLTILIGLMFLDIPGKRRLEQRLVRQPRVRTVIDGLRTRWGRAPLVLDEDETEATIPPKPQRGGR